MTEEHKNDTQQECPSCGELKRVGSFNLRQVCSNCYHSTMARYNENKKEGKHNSPVLWCQDCQSQFKTFDAKIKDPFRNYDDFEKAERVHNGVPYAINPLWLARWKCNCENRKPILTVGMPHSNWAEGFIEQHNKEVWLYDNMTEEEKDEVDGINQLRENKNKKLS